MNADTLIDDEKLGISTKYNEEEKKFSIYYFGLLCLNFSLNDGRCAFIGLEMKAFNYNLNDVEIESNYNKNDEGRGSYSVKVVLHRQGDKVIMDEMNVTLSNSNYEDTTPDINLSMFAKSTLDGEG